MSLSASFCPSLRKASQPAGEGDVGGVRFTVFVPTDVRIVVRDGPSRKVHAMKDETPRNFPPVRRCAFAWCATPHGETLHPADEDHRSEGFALTVRARDVRTHGDGDTLDVEIGVLRRQDDDSTWIVIETGERSSVAIHLDDAGAIGRRILRETQRARGVPVPPTESSIA